MTRNTTDLPSQVRDDEGFMRRRVRKFLGAVAMLVFVSIYALLAMLVAQTDHVRTANGIVQALFFCVVGLAWILPLMPLIRWMERPDDHPVPAGR